MFSWSSTGLLGKRLGGGVDGERFGWLELPDQSPRTAVVAFPL